MPPKKRTYAEALEALELIQQQLENNEIPIDELSTKVEEAAELLSYCQERLRQTSEQVNQTLSDQA